MSITKCGQPLVPREVIINNEWSIDENKNMTLTASSIEFDSDAYFYGFNKQNIGKSGYSMNFNNPIPLPPAEYIPKFNNAESMLRWVLGYLYEYQANKDQLGAD